MTGIDQVPVPRTRRPGPTAHDPDRAWPRTSSAPPCTATRTSTYSIRKWK